MPISSPAAPGLTVLDQLLGHPWHIRWFPREYVSVGPKEADKLELLFVTQSCSDDDEDMTPSDTTIAYKVQIFLKV